MKAAASHEVHENGKDFRIKALYGLTAGDPGAKDQLYKYVSIKWACALTMSHFVRLRVTEKLRNVLEPLLHKQLYLYSLSYVQSQG